MIHSSIQVVSIISIQDSLFPNGSSRIYRLPESGHRNNRQINSCKQNQTWTNTVSFRVEHIKKTRSPAQKEGKASKAAICPPTEIARIYIMACLREETKGSERLRARPQK